MAAVIHGPGYAGYDLGGEHPFAPVRLAMTLDLLRQLGCEPRPIDPPAATRDDILAAHDEAYVRAVEECGAGVRPDCLRFGLGTPDTPVFPGMDAATRALVGGTLLAARMVAEGQASRVLQLGGGLHHARRAMASGFCVYNDLVVAIRELTRRGLWVAYIDIDVHHGDGVQEAFVGDEKVLTVSLHESGHYLFPGTGGIHEIGEGAGRGRTVNLPLEPFTDGASYLEVFEMAVPRALEAFEPSVIVLQAGADGHRDDPLADLALTTGDYERLFRRVVELAEEHAGGRLVATLGGGYSVRAAPRVWTVLYHALEGLPAPDVELPIAWLHRWREQLGQDPPARLHDERRELTGAAQRDEIARRNRSVANRLLDGLAPYWF